MWGKMDHYNSIPKDANTNMKCIRHNDFLANVVICNFSKIFVSLLYDEKNTLFTAEMQYSGCRITYNFQFYNNRRKYI